MPPKYTLEKAIEVFWSRVDRSGDCWEWTAGLSNKGYGKFRWKGRNDLAHRVSYELAFGPIPDGLLVCHTCDNRKCVRPDHFFTGTAKDNAVDAEGKGRLHRIPAQQKARGERHGSAKLTEQQVKSIRESYAKGGTTYKRLGDQYGVTEDAILRIVRRMVWKHVA